MKLSFKFFKLFCILFCLFLGFGTISAQEDEFEFALDFDESSFEEGTFDIDDIDKIGEDDLTLPDQNLEDSMSLEEELSKLEEEEFNFEETIDNKQTQDTPLNDENFNLDDEILEMDSSEFALSNENLEKKSSPPKKMIRKNKPSNKTSIQKKQVRAKNMDPNFKNITKKKKPNPIHDFQRKQGDLKDVISSSNILREMIESNKISENCKDMLKNREQKQSHLQRIKSLATRGEDSLKKVPPHKLTIRKKLELTKVQLKNELTLSEFKLANLEEKIIRSGCPGINIH